LVPTNFCPSFGLKCCTGKGIVFIVETSSDNRYDSRFDSDFATRLLLDLAQERSLDGLMEKSLSAAMTQHEIARAEIWLIEKGDICLRCAQKPRCPDQTRCLHLVAACENPAPAGARESSLFYNTQERIPLGVGFIGRIATTGQLTELQNSDDARGEFSVPGSLQTGETRRCAGSAISFRGEILGVLAIFARVNITKDRRAWQQIFSDHFGAAIANARAFEEIQRLKSQLEMQNAYLQEEVVEAKAFGGLVGQSRALQHIVNQIDHVAPTEATALVLGESGTGKELVAREIHHRSRRKDKPLVRVNCASIPKDLFESEFFGHTRGAFTGAIKDRAGRFEAAEGGTIFLDEIGEVPLDLQGKLLRVLQEKSFERVGEDRTRQADVRVVAATNRDLKQEVAAGRFREDLYYRLNVFPIQVPPLRERMEDVALLAKHFIESSVKELGCLKPRLTRAAIAKLQNYHWPGNIRELRNVIERAIIISRGGALDFDLPVTTSTTAAPRSTPQETDATEPEILTEPEIQRRERDNLLAALRKANWKIKGADGAAELLEVKPTTLKARIKKMGLRRPI
jgi:formate hydrogenlyase transcriptional activator